MKDKPPKMPLPDRKFVVSDIVYTIWKGKVQRGVVVDLASSSDTWMYSVLWDGGVEDHDNRQEDLNRDKDYVEYVYNYNLDYWKKFQ